MLIYSARNLNVYRDGLGYRFTIATAHSTTKMTPREAQELSAALAADTLALLGGVVASALDRVTVADVVKTVKKATKKRGRK